MGVLMIRRVLMSVLVTVMAFAAVISGAALLADRDAVAVLPHLSGRMPRFH